MSFSPNIVWDSGVTTIGDMNCPRYSEAESNGITVVTELFPPFIDAIVFKYGTPIPLAIPENIHPMIIISIEPFDVMKHA